MADMFDLNVGGVGWHLTTGLIALVALFVACFAITGYITFRSGSIPASAFETGVDMDPTFDEVTARTVTATESASVSGDLTVDGHATVGALTAGTIAHAPTTGIGGRSLHDPARYYLQENFLKRPALNGVMGAAFGNADATQGATTVVAVARAIANTDFEVLGTNMTTALCTFSGTGAGILLTTAGQDQDQAILTPHLDTNQTRWAGASGIWGSENSVHFDTTILLPAIDNQIVWAGLKLTNVPEVAADNTQAFFTFLTDATNAGQAMTDFTRLHFVHSIDGVDFISQLPIVVAANTAYRLQIEIDASRQVAIFVNGVQYDVTTTAGSTLGTPVAVGTARSAALDDNVNFIPYIGIEAGAAAAEVLEVHYLAMSRLSART